MLIITLSVFSVCKISINRWVRLSLIIISSIVYLSVISIGHLDIFYKSATLESENGASYIANKEYGFMHTVFYMLVIGYFIASFIGIIYCYFKKKQTSRINIILLFTTEVIGVFSFFFGRLFLKSLELMPFAYTFDLLVYLIISGRFGMYNITDTAIDSIVESGDTGFISFDFRLNYLGSNETAKNIINELNYLIVDRNIEDPFLNDTIIKWINIFKNDNSRNTYYYKIKDKTYLFTITYLYDGFSNKGYQITLKDDTRNQEYIELINNYNSDLKEEVLEKTHHIMQMHDNFILGMAVMIESRDNSTGGHINRTSEGVRILVEEMKKDEDVMYSDAFYTNIIKAAPMHDLGKIAVDDAILRKPGKFTESEYNEMKKHPAEGAKIIDKILDDSSNPEFKKIAMNVAHFHHERVDGSGYPMGLKGDEIPIEARIMAIADVYDALVSKRVYKDKFSFEDAYNIIMDGMGTQFDKNLEKYFVSAREKLEEYYSKIDC